MKRLALFMICLLSFSFFAIFAQHTSEMLTDLRVPVNGPSREHVPINPQATFDVAERRSSYRPLHDTSLRASLNGLERLEADYSSGKISIDQYLLYKTWAVFDLERLSNTEYALSPEEVKTYRKSGTMLLLEIREKWNILSSETQNQLSFVFERPTDVGGGIDGNQHLLPQFYNTTNFVIHWTNGTDGGIATDAVPLADANTNGVPDYVENFAAIFENVRNFEVTTRGFQAPPNDTIEPNDPNRRNPDGRYDVFIYNMGYYGYANAEQYPTTPSYSFIGVDNDYSGFSTPQLQAMQVTAAHEFFHAIQFCYDCTEESWWMETTATYMEDEVYPDVNDNYQYLPYWFQNSGSQGLESTQESHEYGNFIFAKRLSEDFGDIIIREIWEEMNKTGIDGLTALDNVLVNKGSDLEKEFSQFTIANFFLEDMYVDGTDYRANLTGTTTFNGVYLEYQYSASTQPPGYIIIDQGNVNWKAWMAKWAAAYITLTLDPTIENYRVFFDGLNATTNYLVKLVTKKNGVIANETFSLDAQKDGYIDLSYDTFENITLIIANAGNTDTADPSWRVIITHGIAVTYPGYDMMQDVLDSMDIEYTEIDPSELANPYDPTSMTAPYLKPFDVIFINCAGGLQSIAASSAESLRQYVDIRGGIIYASDWAFVFLTNSFLGYVNFIGYDGETGWTDGQVIDPGLADYLETTAIDLYFDLGAWIPIDSVSGDVKIYVRGDVSYWLDEELVTQNKPITVGFEYGNGTVVYTSFHHAVQGPLAARLMEYLVLTTLTEDIAKETKDILENEGFNVVKDNRGRISEGETHNFTYTALKGETFRILLNWKASNSTFRLSVYEPDGTLYGQVESDTPPIGITVTNAKSTYTYNITGVIIPTANYTYAVACARSCAHFTYSPVNPLVNETVTFNATLSTPNGGTIINYTWAFGDGFQGEGIIVYHNYSETGTYNVTLTVIDSEGSNNTVWATVTVLIHDVTVLSVTPSMNEVYEGQTMNITVVIRNNGNFTESFNVTIYANTTIIQTQTVSDLAPGNQTTLTFTWNTTGVSLGNFTIKAEASVVSEEGETHAADNVKINGTVYVIPEFPSFLILPVFMIMTLLAVILYRRKRTMQC